MRLAPAQAISAKKFERYTALYTGLIRRGRPKRGKLNRMDTTEQQLADQRVLKTNRSSEQDSVTADTIGLTLSPLRAA